MPTPCPQCGVDTSQSSGIVCPACGHILRPGADDRAHEQQMQPGRRGLRLALAFLIPFGLGLTCVSSLNGPLGAGLVCGTVLGLLFLGCFALASKRASSALGQAFGGLLLFLGLLAVVAGVVFVGCGFALG